MQSIRLFIARARLRRVREEITEYQRGIESARTELDLLFAKEREARATVYCLESKPARDAPPRGPVPPWRPMARRLNSR